MWEIDDGLMSFILLSPSGNKQGGASEKTVVTDYGFSEDRNTFVTLEQGIKTTYYRQGTQPESGLTKNAFKDL